VAFVRPLIVEPYVAGVVDVSVRTDPIVTLEVTSVVPLNTFTVYPAMEVPPSDVGAFQVAVAVPSPGVA
jgi:hypothetical protein